ncbi:VOC family protein [Pedobacter lusitanus]|nr:VOC family protein [Pedobacter lusitanus]
MIDHIAIAVNNLQESIKLYNEVLGFELVEKRTTQGEYSGMHSAVLNKNGTVIVLLESEGTNSQISQFIDAFGTGVQHVAISVSNIEDTLSKLDAHENAAEIDIIEGDGIRQVFLRRDIGSGVRLELIERNGGTFNDASINKMFRSFEEKKIC